MIVMSTYLRARSLRLALTLLFVFCTMGAFGQGGAPGGPGPGGRSFVPGELIIAVRTGTTRAQVDALAVGVNASVFRYFGIVDSVKRTEAYQLQMTNALTVKDADLQQAIGRIKQ